MYLAIGIFIGAILRLIYDVIKELKQNRYERKRTKK